MQKIRQISSPGVEITEIDQTLSYNAPVGTSVFATGFASQGPVNEVIQVNSIGEFESIYGKPTTSAERYFYYTAKQVLQSSNAIVYVSRLPYGATTASETKYGALVYPAGTIFNTDNVDVFTDEFDYADITQGTYMKEITISENVSVTALSSTNVTYLSVADSAAIATLTSSNFQYVSQSPVDGGVSVVFLSSFTATNTVLSTYTVEEERSIVDTNVRNVKHVLGKPIFVELTQTDYRKILDGSAFTWKNTGKVADVDEYFMYTGLESLGNAGMIILNPTQSMLNAQREGLYVAIADNTNAEPTVDHKSITNIYTITETISSSGELAYSSLPLTKLSFPLSASAASRATNSLSYDIEKAFFVYPDAAESAFADSLAINVYRLHKSAYANDVTRLDYTPVASVLGSLDYHRKLQSRNGGTPTSYFVENLASQTGSVKVMVNDYISQRSTDTWLGDDSLPKKQVRVVTRDFETSLSLAERTAYTNLNAADALFSMGTLVSEGDNNKIIGNISSKVGSILEKLDNDEIFPVDIVVEGGLGTIQAAIDATAKSTFDDTDMTPGFQLKLDTLSQSNLAQNDLVDSYNSVFGVFNTFCSVIRKDCLFIADPIRHIFVRGKDSLVLDDKSKTFNQHIYSSLKKNFAIANTSYACSYANWIKVKDVFSDSYVWMPFSGFAAADFIRSDNENYPWSAPAGFKRGVITGAIALAIQPKQKERDQLYKINLNPVAFFPNDGIVIFGQKTLLRQPSAFDRINVRRLFLYLEKATKNTVKYFVFEPNSVATRTRIIQTLTPLFELAKNTDGVYEYMLVCDKRNNTPSTIDRNEIILDIYLKPVRTGEFILVNFIATRTDTVFAELI